MAKNLHALNRRAKRRAARPEFRYCEFEYRPVAHYEDDPRYSPTKKQCGNEGMACYLPDDLWRDRVTEYLCGEHREIEGYCVGCGIFYAGIEFFDFGPYRGFCDNCSSEIEAEEYNEQREFDEEYYGYAYDDDY